VLTFTFVDLFRTTTAAASACCLLRPHPSADATALTQWGLSGPTIFAQMIQAAGKLAEGAMFEANLNGSAGAYTILLILTDGEISDMEATKEAIVAVSGLPLSIIIIGVGDADFDKMVK